MITVAFVRWLPACAPNTDSPIPPKAAPIPPDFDGWIRMIPITSSERIATSTYRKTIISNRALSFRYVSGYASTNTLCPVSRPRLILAPIE